MSSDASGKEQQQSREHPERRDLAREVIVERPQARDCDTRVGLAKRLRDAARDSLLGCSVPNQEGCFTGRSGLLVIREKHVARMYRRATAAEVGVADDAHDFRPERAIGRARDEYLADGRFARPECLRQILGDDGGPASAGVQRVEIMPGGKRDANGLEVARRRRSSAPPARVPRSAPLAQGN